MNGPALCVRGGPQKPDLFMSAAGRGTGQGGAASNAKAGGVNAYMTNES